MLVVFVRLNSGELDIGGYFEQVINKLPPVLTKDFGPISNIDISKVSEKVTDFAVSSGQFLTRKAVSIGSNTFQFIISLVVMLFLLYFLLRDGRVLTHRISMLVS